MLKKYIKFIIGAAVLVLVGVAFFLIMRSSDLESGTMRNWRAASAARRETTVKILTGGEEHTELMMQCMDKIATLPDSFEMPIKDAASLCFMGIQLKENI